MIKIMFENKHGFKLVIDYVDTPIDEVLTKTEDIVWEIINNKFLNDEQE